MSTGHSEKVDVRNLDQPAPQQVLDMSDWLLGDRILRLIITQDLSAPDKELHTAKKLT